MKKLFLAVVAALFSTAAMAADVIVQTPVESLPGVSVSTWTGAYVAGTAGYARSKRAHAHENVNTFGGPGGTYEHKSKGFVGGVVAGYQHEFSNKLVLGARAGIRSGQSGDDGGAYKIYNNTTSSKLHYLATAEGTIGVDMGRVMPYVHGGWAGGKLSTSQVYAPPGSPATTWEGSQFRNGWTAGVGVDYKVTDKVFVGIEYAHTDLGTAHFSGNDSNGTPTKISSKYREDSIMARLGILF
jgi:opacity protein-like surface antigen